MKILFRMKHSTGKKKRSEVLREISCTCAMRMLQRDMRGEFERAGLKNDDDIMALVKEVRAEIEGL